MTSSFRAQCAELAGVFDYDGIAFDEIRNLRPDLVGIDAGHDEDAGFALVQTDGRADDAGDLHPPVGVLSLNLLYRLVGHSLPLSHTNPTPQKPCYGV